MACKYRVSVRLTAADLSARAFSDGCIAQSSAEGNTLCNVSVHSYTQFYILAVCMIQTTMLQCSMVATWLSLKLKSWYPRCTSPTLGCMIL